MTTDTTPEADLIKRAQAALDGYDQQDIADYAHLTFASGVVALAAENAALRETVFKLAHQLDQSMRSETALRAEVERLRGAGWQPIETLPPRFETVDIWVSTGLRVPRVRHPHQYLTATHWWDFGLGQTSPEPPARAALDASK